MSKDLPLDHLKDVTVAFLAYADSLGRPLLSSERRAHRWLLAAFENAAHRQAFERMDEAALAFHTDLLVELREVLTPDPVEQIRLQRKKPERTAELHEGNFSLRTPPFSGVSVRRLNQAEVKERVTLLGRLAEGITTLVRELSLARQRDGAAAGRIVRKAKHLVKLTGAFGSCCKAQPEIPRTTTFDLLMEEARTMNDLMARTADSYSTEGV